MNQSIRQRKAHSAGRALILLTSLLHKRVKDGAAKNLIAMKPSPGYPVIDWNKSKSALCL